MNNTSLTEHSSKNSPFGSPAQFYLTTIPSDSTSSAGIALSHIANVQVNQIVDLNSYAKASLISGQIMNNQKIRLAKFSSHKQCFMILTKAIKIEILPLQQ